MNIFLIYLACAASFCCGFIFGLFWSDRSKS
jgi:hypothetical protein